MDIERGFEVKCLDHGYVRHVDSMGSDEDIVAAARMSTGRGFVSWEPYHRCEKCDCIVTELKKGVRFCPRGCAEGTMKAFPRGDQGILEFMYSHQHMTPFEFGVLHIEVQAPLFVIREWHRHRVQSYSEASARYTQMPNEHYVPELERFESRLTKNKQESSAPFASAEWGQLDNVSDMVSCVRRDQEGSYRLYEQLLSRGVPKEVARINTPVSRYSKMRATTDLRNWLAFLTLRDAPSAQWEIQQYAKAVGQIVKTLWPRTYALWEEYTKYAVNFSRAELEVLRAFVRASELTKVLSTEWTGLPHEQRAQLLAKLKGTTA